MRLFKIHIGFSSGELQRDSSSWNTNMDLNGPADLCKSAKGSHMMQGKLGMMKTLNCCLDNIIS